MMIRVGMKDLAVKLSHSSLARFLQGINYSAGLRRHEGELQQVYDMLADELSRETFRAVISACKSGDYSGMHRYNSRVSTFGKSIVQADSTGNQHLAETVCYAVP